MLGKKWVERYEIEVVVTQGRHKGKLGVIDDWEGEKAIVYLAGDSVSRGDPYFVLPRRQLRLSTIEEGRRRKWIEKKADRTARLEASP